MILTAIDNGDNSVGIPGCEITLDLDDFALDKDDRDQIKEEFINPWDFLPPAIQRIIFPVKA